MKKIKTKPVIKDIKTLKKTADVSRRMKNACIHTKKQTEMPEQNKDGNYVDDAGYSIQGSTETVVKKAGDVAEIYGKKVFGEMKESIRQGVSQNGARRTAKNGSSFRSEIRTEAYPSDTFSKAGSIIKHSAETSRKTAKKTAKGSIKIPHKSVKTAEHTAKATFKTSQTAVKTAAKTTAKSAQVSKRAIQTARMAARATATSMKMAVRAIAITIKATIAAVKGTVALITAGGWIVVIIILVICLAGFLIGSVYGVFFSNEILDPNVPTMSEVISQFNDEFSSEIKRIQDENPHDTLELTGNENDTVNNWPEILAVYAAMVSANQENGMEVATLDDTKVGILRGIFQDMNPVEYWLQKIEHEETVTTTDKEGKEVIKDITVKETVLHINVISKSYLDMIEQYGFSAQQEKMLNELMKEENQKLFIQLIGS